MAAVVATAAAATAGGEVSAARAAACPPPPAAVQPFAAWSDHGSYVLTTGGSFEPGSVPWTLTGGAAVVSDQAPNALDSATSSHALSLPAGSSVTSACVTAPLILGTLRFFARSVGAPGGELKVEILVKGGVYPAGTVAPGSAWAPTPILTSSAPDYSGAVTYQVRLTAIGTGAAFHVDDVYFDPHGTR